MYGLTWMLFFLFFFPAIFTKENNFCDFPVVQIKTNPFKMASTLKGKNLHTQEQTLP